ncbi:cytochrome b5 [Daedalea quercina L-15889]|uniref:Cytochrome b5 n=1 Tax=Daedalea quercina L-15889 TaxID=1314783 RepID=A0A165SU06_9APHY|nr:cytochrome b5 [Daedalea quercina L-15889]
MSETKIITYEELKQNNKKDSLYVLIHQKVYNVSKFIDEHPGGDEVILAETGKDATEAFEDVGHSDEARAILKDLYIGEFEKDGALKAKPAYDSHSSSSQAVNTAVQQGSNMMYFVPLAMLGAYFAWRYYSSGSL